MGFAIVANNTEKKGAFFTAVDHFNHVGDTAQDGDFVSVLVPLK